jgi:Flp pilus assembly protein TadD
VVRRDPHAPRAGARGRSGHGILRRVDSDPAETAIPGDALSSTVRSKRPRAARLDLRPALHHARALLLLVAGLAACGRGGQDAAAPPPRPGPEASAPPAEPAAGYVGVARCGGCHPTEAAVWHGSDHDRAMQVASEATVLGNFDDARFEHFGVTSRFFRRDGGYRVETEGADGRPAEFGVAWTFGVRPLQQYLIRFPRGHVQALGIAWDSRPRVEGGQRWYSLYPNERVPPGDPLYWTQPSQRWNTQCAACHSTNVRRGYDLAHDSYETTWSELDVACEACHGPGARHVAWAEAARRSGTAPAAGGDLGLVVRFPVVRPGEWTLAPGAPIAHLAAPRGPRTELETCAPCHSRRSQLREGALPGTPFLDAYRPSLLEPGLYEADGQIRGEVYVYGSFVQSPMYAAGVTCSDCHDPHSLRRRAEGNALCVGCHRPEVFDAPAHHHHRPGSAGARCVSCHMPARTYMGVDVRRDHSFRVPRPDLSVSIGTPNACTDCHRDRPAKWAADAVARWFPAGRSGAPQYGQALAAGRRGLPGADAALTALAADPAQPAIARATALELLAEPAPAAVRRGAADPDPLVRLGALEAAPALAPAARLDAVVSLLRDPRLAVRIEAARVLAGVPAPLWRPADRSALADGLAEYRAAQHVQDDRPEAHLNLGLLDVAVADPGGARREYDTALRLQPGFVPAVVNLADLDRAEGHDAEAEARLRKALASAPDDASLHHALGLTLVRLGRRDAAVSELERAAELAPEDARYAYVLGVALHDAGQTDRALAVLRAAQSRRPGDRDLLVALVTFSAQAGHTTDAERWARELVKAFPDDPEARKLLAEIQAAAR